MRLLRGPAIMACLALAAAFTSACGESSVNIAASAPLFVLVSRSGDLAVDVIEQSNFQVAGSIVVGSGAGAATGAVASVPGRQLLVTYTGVQVGSQLTVTPDTRVCSLDSSQCGSVWKGWGSATAIPLRDRSVAVPAWNDLDFTKGRLAVFGGSRIGIQHQLNLAESVPGPVTVSPDGRYVYWLTYGPVKTNQNAEQVLLRLDGATGAVLDTVHLGNRLAFGLAVDAGGNLLMSIVFEKAPQRTSGAPPTGEVSGTTLLVYSADLATSRPLKVSAGPTFVATGRNVALVASKASSVSSLGVYDLASGKSIGTVGIPVGWTVQGVQVVDLAGGRQVGMVELNDQARTHYQLGVVDLSSASVAWHKFDGASLGSLAA